MASSAIKGEAVFSLLEPMREEAEIYPFLIRRISSWKEDEH